MQTDFHWEFQDDPPGRDRKGGPPAGERQPRWVKRGAIIAALLVLLGFAVRSWNTDRHRTLTEAEAQLRATVQLELDTIASGDVELFQELQDPSDGAWRNRQLLHYQLTSAGRPSPAPGLRPAPRPPDITSTLVLGREGRVGIRWWFLSSQGDPTLLPFQTVWVYRQADDGTWYHVQPPEEGVGRLATWHGERLMVRATQNELETLGHSLESFDRLLVRACRLIACPAVTGPMLRFMEIPETRIQGDFWGVPALYLAGQPQDERARTAWETEMARWLVGAVARSRAGYRDVADRVIFDQVATRLQAELGLVPAPEPDVELLRQALAAQRQHPLQALWQAEYGGLDSESRRLVETEVMVLLDSIQEGSGPVAVYGPLPALKERERPAEALLPDALEVTRAQFFQDWRDYLHRLTGETVVFQSILPTVPPTNEVVVPQPIRPPFPLYPGNQIALVCDERIWVGNADGRRLLPLTPADQRFVHPQWSPDGRQIATTWLAGPPARSRALFVIAADGSGGQPLLDRLANGLWSHGWSPHGRELLFETQGGIQALQVTTGGTRDLPGLVVRSPDGLHEIIYSSESRAAWLAGAERGGYRPIGDDQVVRWVGPWSPDGRNVALVLAAEGSRENVIGLYQLSTDQITPTLGVSDVMSAVFAARVDTRGSASTGWVSDGAELAPFTPGTYHWIWPMAWSADGRRLLIYLREGNGWGVSRAPALLVALPLDGSPPRLVASGVAKSVQDAAWSPVDPDRLVFRWIDQANVPRRYAGFLYDTDAGVLYSRDGIFGVSWSPDGDWVAFLAEDTIRVVDRDGRERFAFAPGGRCTELAWNPTADLSRLARSPLKPSSN